MSADTPEWQSNCGHAPTLSRVDIKLNEDEDCPGIQMVRYNVNPREWDWSRFGLHITHYREAA